VSINSTQEAVHKRLCSRFLLHTSCTCLSHVFVQQDAVTRSPRNFVPESRLVSCCSRENDIQRFLRRHLLNVYSISRAQKLDEEDAENWKGGAEGILVFVRWIFNYQDGCLLTGSLLSDRSFCIHGGHLHFHTFISISYQSLQQDPYAITQSLLTQISQQLPGSQMLPQTTQVHQSMLKITSAPPLPPCS
jgi:Family of unknown function (DUF6535)